MKKQCFQSSHDITQPIQESEKQNSLYPGTLHNSSNQMNQPPSFQTVLSRLSSQNNTPPVPLSCSFCPKSFKDKHKLKQHLDMHNNIKSYSAFKQYLKLCYLVFYSWYLARYIAIIYYLLKPFFFRNLVALWHFRTKKNWRGRDRVLYDLFC